MVDAMFRVWTARWAAIGVAIAAGTAGCSSKGSGPPGSGGGGASGGSGGGTGSGGGGDRDAGGAGDRAAPLPAFQALCPADNWCWEHPLPQGNDLLAVFGTGPGDVWAVGDEGTILHWDGRTFGPAASGTLERLTGVWAASPSEAWISGTVGSFLRWDGQRWSPAGQPASVDAANAVTGMVDRSGAAPVTTVVFATGTAPTQVRGGAWITGAAAPDPPFTANAVWTDATGAVWSGGSGGRVAVLQGGVWTTVASAIDPATSVLGIGGDPQGNVWVVGQGGQSARIDPRKVAAAFTTGSTGDLNGVWASRFDDAWAVGAGGTLLHFDGARWQPRTSGTTFDLRAVWGSAASDVWVVGDRGTIIHYDGTAWTSPNGETGLKLNAAWGASLSDVWAVGDGGMVLRRQNGQWQRWPSPTDQPLLAVWGSGQDDVWMGGDAVLQWDGTVLSVYGGLAVAGALSGRAADDVWANARGVAAHFDGKTWTAMTRKIAGSIFEAAKDDLWVSSIDGEASAGHWNGQAQTWAKWPLSDCLQLHGSGPNDVWCVGGTLTASVQHWDGTAWQALTSPVRPGLNAAVSGGINQIWFAGGDGAIGSCNGATCAGRGLVGGTAADKLARGEFVAEQLTGLAAVGQDVFVVGSRAVILHRHP
jgi:hypothetical protein